MKRRTRILLEVFSPPLLGTGLLLIVAIMGEVMGSGPNSGIRGSANEILYCSFIVLVAAYMYAGIQSIICAIIMEWRFSRGLDPGSWRTVGLAALLGFVSGAAPLVVLGFSPSKPIELWLVMTSLGLAVGFCMGLLIKVCSAHGKNRGGPTP